MEAFDRNQWMNKALLVVGLTWIRLPRLFDLEDNPWVMILSLLPFWYVTISNHLSGLNAKGAERRQGLRLLIQIALLFNILGLLLVVSTVFVRAFVDESSFAYQAFAFLLLVAVMAGALAAYAAVVRELGFKPALAILGVIYYLLVSAAILRASTLRPFLLLTIYQLITVIAFAFSAKSTLRKKGDGYLVFAATGLLVYLALNVGLHWAGIQNPNENYFRQFEAVTLSWLGIKAYRVYFPMAEGINSLGMVSGLGMVFCAVFLWSALRDGRHWRQVLPPVMGGVVCLYVLLATDSRGGLAFGLLASGLMIFPFLYQRLAALVGVFLVPLIVLFQSELIAGLPFLSRFSRSGADVLSGRSAIWASALGELAHFQPIHLIGYGLYGQTSSGIVRSYQDLFSSYVNTSIIPLHHFYLQSIFDLGYIGLAAGLAFMFMIGRTLQARLKTDAGDQEAALAVAGLIYCVLIGSVSTIPAFYGRELFFLLPFIWVAAGSKRGLAHG